MIALKMEDIKTFTSGLFVGTTFDKFLLREAVITTFNTFTIDGHIKTGYYSGEELKLNQIQGLSSWSVIKPICFSLIKGKRLPGSFQITLQLAPDGVERLLQAHNFNVTVDQVAGFYLNIRYENSVLNCITGTSLKVFVMDKMIDTQWDETVRAFLKKEELYYSQDY